MGGDVFSFFAVIFDLNVDSDFKEIVDKTAAILNIDTSAYQYAERANAIQRDINSWLSYISHNEYVPNAPYDISVLGQTYKLNSFRNISPELLAQYKIGYNKDYSRIQVPLYDSQNRVVGASLRKTLSDDSPKWLHRPRNLQTKLLLYNWNNLPSVLFNMYIVEGVWDALNIVQHNFKEVVATFGAHLTEEQEELLLTRCVGITLAYDSDKAGELATIKAIKKLNSKCNLKILDFHGEFHDPGEFDEHCTPEWFNNHIIRPLDYILKYGSV